MMVIGNIVLSEEILEQEFVCNLSKCKGECCIAGDAGAPLKPEEVRIMTKEYPKIKDYLTLEGREAIDKQGVSVFDSEDGDEKTVLIDGGPCAFINYDTQGIAVCGIEKAYLDKKTAFRKPISCHLYPIRASQVGEMTALNYEQWDICSDACTLGKEIKVPVYKFLKEPLIRAYGEEFYQVLEQYSDQKQKHSK